MLVKEENFYIIFYYIYTQQMKQYSLVILSYLQLAQLSNHSSLCFYANI